MIRPYYFGSGPACLPEEVLQSLQKNWFNWESTGVSILEIGHRTAAFQQRLQDLEQLVRDLLGISPVYHVLFLSFPMRVHFDLIPQHFLTAGTNAAYLVSGHWSAMALEQAQKISSRAYVMATCPVAPSKTLPRTEDWIVRDPLAYVYFTPNETLDGVFYQPDLSGLQSPVIADMTSCLFTQSIDMNKYACVIAGSQKNFGTAGMGLVIVHKNLLHNARDNQLLTYLDYRTYAQHNSMCVTPPIINCEVSYQMLKWMQQRGGVSYFAEENKKKAQKLYDYLDSSLFYKTRVAKQARSMVNVTFHLANAELEPAFFVEAKKQGFLGLEGHRAVGGIRVGMYNSVSVHAVEKLIDFMQNFAKLYYTDFHKE